MSHYCKICQTYKANEKFSGKGHSAHICKACKGKPLPKKEKTPKPIKNPFMKQVKIQEVISFMEDSRMMILFKRGSQEYVAYREDYDLPYQIYQFIRKEEHFEVTTAFSEEMAQYAIERKADFISIYVTDWVDFENVTEQIIAYEQILEFEDDEDFEHNLPEGSFVEHCYAYENEQEQLLLRNLYKLKEFILLQSLVK